MKITEVRINKYENKNVKGFASITFDSELVVNGFTIMTGKNGLFVSMPSTKGKDGEYHDSVFPLSKKGRDQINKVVLDAYKEVEEDPFS